MAVKKRIDRFRRMWLHLRLQPIRVFCFHQVSDEFDSETMMESDWIQTDNFKRCILSLKERYTFITLPEVTRHLKHDRFRNKKYAVLTADDGWASLKNVIPWLAEQSIPLTLFINPSYLDGEHYRERCTEKYLTLEDVEKSAVLYKNLSVAMHGWEHKDVRAFSESEFRDDIEKSKLVLSVFSCYIPYFAYPWGKHTLVSDSVLHECGLTPVLMDGMKNYSDPYLVHRELITE